MKRKTTVTLYKGLLFVEGSHHFYAVVWSGRANQRCVDQTVLRLPEAGLSLWQGWHPAVMLGSLLSLVAWSTSVCLGCVLLLSTGLSWGKKRNETSFVLSECQFESFFLSLTSPCLEGTSEEAHGHSSTRVSKSKWMAKSCSDFLGSRPFLGRSELALMSI